MTAPKIKLQLREDWIQALSRRRLGDVEYRENSGSNMKDSDGTWNLFGVLTDLAIRYYGFKGEWLPAIDKHNPTSLRFADLRNGAPGPEVAYLAPRTISMAVGLTTPEGCYKHPRDGTEWDLARCQHMGMADLRYDFAQRQFVKSARVKDHRASFPELAQILRLSPPGLWIDPERRKGTTFTGRH